MISINYRDSRPVYEQIKSFFKNQMFLGLIKKDDKLPSIREMATELAINPNTIQRAYRELEAEGYIYSVAGTGSFAEDVSKLAEDRKMQIYEKIKELLKELADYGTDRFECEEALKQCVQDIYLNNEKRGEGT